MRPLLFATLLLAAVPLHAQTYRWVDPATGKKVISDNPPPSNAKQVTQAREGAAGQSEGLPFATRRAVENFPVTLYTAPDCVEACRQARDLLNKRGIPFTEKMIEKQADIDEMKQQFGDAVAPMLKVGRQTVRGYSDAAYHNVLDLAGYPTSAPVGSKPSGGLPQ